MASTTSTLPRVLVTGASGFLGSQIVYQLLEAGYPVRGTARGAKVNLLRNAFKKYDQFDAVDVPDVSSSDLTEAFRGVGALIHTAAPLPGRADPETALRSAIDGSLHILREAVRAGVKKAVVTSSMVSFPFGGPYGVDDWHPITKEEALSGGYMTTYFAEKKFADQAVMEFADSHPEIDVTSISPPWIFGPFAPGFEEIVPTPDFRPFSSNGYIYALLRPDNTYYPTFGGTVDVRDVARAHIAALNSTPSSVVGRKRFVLIPPHSISYSDAIRFISEERPELRECLADPVASAPPSYEPLAGIERQKLADVVGITSESYRSWKDTVLDTVDSLLALEKSWKEKGHSFEMPKTSPM